MLVTVRANPPHTIDSQLSPLAELDRYLHARRQQRLERQWLREWEQAEQDHVHGHDSAEGMGAND